LAHRSNWKWIKVLSETRPELYATLHIDAGVIAQLAFRSINENPTPLKEKLLLSKNEQTFSGLLAQELTRYPTLALGNGSESGMGRVLLELKGKDYQKYSAGGIKTSRNFHDLTIVTPNADIEVIIENKFWYHFDGAKGKNNPKPEKGIGIQIKDDIFKIRQTLSDTKHGRGFLLLNIVTPGDPDSIPKSYQDDHQRAWSRTNGDFENYRAEGLNGIKSALNTFAADFVSMEIESSDWGSSLGAADFICAEVRIN
jgi:hypothetical protein